ncbi:hypothetical protein GCM10009868_08530 [Terrabacter aerolatus]|uniref:Glycosyltransferase RgtA/B/C/D-like domain-containing protein n=1 Tax=Terrabacter aerolatus TaxID=422442 RepID=A0A512D5W8_9MICO|nr:hypothetical protein [Terrabacter aerolatus]GEO31862.1 hypothetical protein TAE01_36720 [Terrabacter aerolatus]
MPLVVLRAGTLAETDTFWQVRTGLLTMEHRSLPRVDPFSWTAHGEPWTLNSWGYNVVVGAAYQLAGLPGVALVCGGIVLATAAVVLVSARRLGSSPLMAAAVLLLTSPVLVPWLSARPQLVDYVAVMVLLLLLVNVVDGRRPWVAVLAVGLVMALWVNLHAAALLGVAIAGLTALLLLTRRTTRGAGRRCLAATAAAAGGALANPYGIGLFTQTASVKDASSDVVVEWQHLDPTSPAQLVMLLIGIAGLVVAVRRRDAVFTSALMVTTLGSLLAIRILPVLVLAAVPVVAAALTGLTSDGRSRRVYRVVVAVSAAVLVSLVALSVPSLGHVGRPDTELYPAAVVTQIPDRCHVFNSYLVGGFVLLERPDVLVSIDSRNDFYGTQRVLAAERLIRGEGDVTAGLAGAGCVLVPPSSGLAQRLTADPTWRLRASEPGGALFVRA